MWKPWVQDIIKHEGTIKRKWGVCSYYMRYWLRLTVVQPFMSSYPQPISSLYPEDIDHNKFWHTLTFIFPVFIFLCEMTFLITETFHIFPFPTKVLFIFWLMFIWILLSQPWSTLRILRPTFTMSSLWRVILILETVYEIWTFCFILFIVTLFLILQICSL